MTWEQLAQRIQQLTQEQKQQDATVYFRPLDEYYPVNQLTIETESDVLDAGHPVLQVKG